MLSTNIMRIYEYFFFYYYYYYYYYCRIKISRTSAQALKRQLHAHFESQVIVVILYVCGSNGDGGTAFF